MKRAIASCASVLMLLGCDGSLTLGDPAGASDDDAMSRGATGEAGADAFSNDAAEAEAIPSGDAPSPFRCTLESQCAVAMLHCDVPTGACVACTTDAQCNASHPRCDVSLHRCVECGIDADCPAGDICEKATRRCVLGCTPTTACPPTAPTCDATRGICVGCTNDAACGLKRHCEVASGRCVDCLRDDQCPKDHPRCEVVAARCVACLGSADCPPTRPLCDPVAAYCVPGK